MGSAFAKLDDLRTHWKYAVLFIDWIRHLIETIISTVGAYTILALNREKRNLMRRNFSRLPMPLCNLLVMRIILHTSVRFLQLSITMKSIKIDRNLFPMQKSWSGSINLTLLYYPAAQIKVPMGNRIL